MSGSAVVPLLRRLVAARSDNPGGDGRSLAALLEAELSALRPDRVELIPEGSHASVLAVWGAPRLLVNAHLDTVPADRGWSSDPFVARVEGERLIGLGACDIKGAIAAVLCAADATRPRDTAILFSGDEEATSSCMRSLVGGELQRRAGGKLARALVCEPTSMRVGVRHRGIMAFEVARSGEGGHSSRADRLPRPIAELARVAVALDDWGQARVAEGPPGFQGMCFNVAQLDGGVAFNVVPASATLSVSLRPPPSADVPRIRAELQQLVAGISPEGAFRLRIENPPFATRERERFRDLLGARVDQPVDLGFWTEAALLSQDAGVDAVVIGPGDIAQAHAPDEWVTIAELDAAVEMFRSVFEATRGAG